MDFRLYQSLCEADPRNGVLCKSVAPMLFDDLNRILINNMVLQFSKITDPAKSGRKDNPNLNITTNYIVKEIAWPDDVRQKLQSINQRLNKFRKYIEPARSKRIAHVDLPAQMEKWEALGKFPKGADEQFVQDLQEFINVAYGHFHQGSVCPIDPGTTSTDTYRLVRALEKSVVFDCCTHCDDNEKNIALLDYIKRP